MERKLQHPAVIAAGLLLALGTGCAGTQGAGGTTQTARAQRPDVLKPGVLPPPNELLRPAGALANPPGAVVPAGGALSAAPVVPAGGAPQPPGAKPAALAKLMARERPPVPAGELQVAWRKQIGHLPDPTKNGVPVPGVVGQMFLYGGPMMEFVEANGVLTIDLVDDTPRPDGRPAAKAERWQFPKEVLRRMKTGNETFGKSYVLFLPWPDYRPDITRVRVSARYDPEDGHTLFAQPTTVTFDNAPEWNSTTVTTTTSPGVKPGTMVGALPLPDAPPAPSYGPPIAIPPPTLPTPAGAPTLGPIPPGAPVVPAAPAAPLPPLSFTVGR